MPGTQHYSSESIHFVFRHKENGLNPDQISELHRQQLPRARKHPAVNGVKYILSTYKKGAQIPWPCVDGSWFNVTLEEFKERLMAEKTVGVSNIESNLNPSMQASNASTSSVQATQSKHYSPPFMSPRSHTPPLSGNEPYSTVGSPSARPQIASPTVQQMYGNANRLPLIQGQQQTLQQYYNSPSQDPLMMPFLKRPADEAMQSEAKKQRTGYAFSQPSWGDIRTPPRQRIEIDLTSPVQQTQKRSAEDYIQREAKKPRIDYSVYASRNFCEDRGTPDQIKSCLLPDQTQPWQNILGSSRSPQVQHGSPSHSTAMSNPYSNTLYPPHVRDQIFRQRASSSNTTDLIHASQSAARTPPPVISATAPLAGHSTLPAPTLTSFDIDQFEAAPVPDSSKRVSPPPPVFDFEILPASNLAPGAAPAATPTPEPQPNLDASDFDFGAFFELFPDCQPLEEPWLAPSPNVPELEPSSATQIASKSPSKEQDATPSNVSQPSTPSPEEDPHPLKWTPDSFDQFDANELFYGLNAEDLSPLKGPWEVAPIKVSRRLFREGCNMLDAPMILDETLPNSGSESDGGDEGGEKDSIKEKNDPQDVSKPAGIVGVGDTDGHDNKAKGEEDQSHESVVKNNQINDNDLAPHASAPGPANLTSSSNPANDVDFSNSNNDDLQCTDLSDWSIADFYEHGDWKDPMDLDLAEFDEFFSRPIE